MSRAREHAAALYAVAEKELRQTLRDKRMISMLMMAPIIQLIVFGTAVDLDVDKVPTVVVDQDHTRSSRAHLRRIVADGTLTKVGERETAEAAAAELVAGRAVAVVVVPRGFERRLARGDARDPAEVQVLLDGTNPNQTGVAQSAGVRYFGAAGAEWVMERLARGGLAATAGRRLPSTVELAPRVMYNPKLETAVYMVPGIASMLLLVVTTIVTAMGLARERETGTLEQILVTPVRPIVLLVGKMLPFAAIGLIDFGIAMVVGAYVFDMPIRGAPPLLGLTTALYLLTTLAMGLLISTVSTTQQQAFMGGFLFMMPAALLSGIMTPIRSMPEWLQLVTLLNPLRHYASALRAVLLRGAGPEDVAVELLALAAFGLSLSTLAALRFRKTMG